MTSNIHTTAFVENKKDIPETTKIWAFTHVREGAHIGEQVSVGAHCYIENGVIVGNGTRIQNHVSVYNGVVLGERVFVGQHVVFGNDKYPKVNNDHWEISKTIIEDNVTIGMGAVIVPGVTIGTGAFIGAGALVTKDVEPYTTVINKNQVLRKNAKI